MWGIPITRSMTQLIKWSSQERPVAAATPTNRAITALTLEAIIPTEMLTESPFTVRTSISLPKRSVPKGCSREGFSAFFEKSA